MESKLDKLKKQTANATKWSAITEIASKCIVPFSNMILARLLTPESFGIVATVTMLTSFADMIADAGFQKYLVQHEFSENEDIDKSTNVAFWTNIVFSVLLWGVIFTYSEELAVMVGNPGIGDVIALASPTILLIAFSSIQVARLKRDFEFRTLFIIRMTTMLIPIVVTLPLAYFQRSFWALIIGNILHHFINAIILTYYSKWKPKLFYDLDIFRKMFQYSWWILLESFGIWLTEYIGIFIVGIFLNSYYIGIYKIAIVTVNQIMSLITATTSMPLFVALSRLQNNEVESINIYRFYIKAISIITVPLGVGICLYSDLITEILLGEQWIEASEFIGLLGLTSSVSLVLGTYCNGYYNAKGKTYLSFIAQLLYLLALIPALYFGVAQGYDTLYEVRSFIRLEFVAVQLGIMWFVLNFPVFVLLKDIAPAVIGSIILVICDFILKMYGNYLWWQVVSIFVCMIVYVSFIRICFKNVFKDTLQAFGINCFVKDFIA